MKEIYWLSVVGNLSIVLWVLFIMGIVTTAVLVSITCDDDLWTYSTGGKEKNWKGAIISGCVTVLSALLLVFTPSKEDIYLIYGLGSTIDYIKTNDTARQLPDKVVNALDVWVESMSEDKDND